MRRLVIVIALTAMPPVRAAGQRPFPSGEALRAGAAGSARMAPRSLALPLLDPLKRRHARACRTLAVPRISLPGITVPHPLPAPSPPPRPDDRIDATRLALRLRALAAVLDDLPRHARRFARWHARTNAARRASGAQLVRRLSPLRPGFAPGQRRRRVAHKVHEVLADMQHFARAALRLRADTS